MEIQAEVLRQVGKYADYKEKTYWHPRLENESYTGWHFNYLLELNVQFLGDSRR